MAAAEARGDLAAVSADYSAVLALAVESGVPMDADPTEAQWMLGCTDADRDRWEELGDGR